MTNTHSASCSRAAGGRAGGDPPHQRGRRPIALQIALLIPLVAALLGLFIAFRMTRLPDPEPSAAAEGMLAG
jgi:hypothetical protein